MKILGSILGFLCGFAPGFCLFMFFKKKREADKVDCDWSKRMGFGCTIKTKKGELTGFDEPGKIHYQLLGLSYPKSPNNISCLRDTLCWFPEITGTHAQYIFSLFKDRVLENIQALSRIDHPECPHCRCHGNLNPTEEMIIVANTDPADIVSIQGGY